MPGGRGAWPKPEATEAPVVKKKTYEIVEEDLHAEEGGGYTLGFAGQGMTGKTISAMTLGKLRMDNIENLRKNGLEYLAKALEDGSIPYINKVVVIESENAMKKQMGRPLERKILYDVIPITKRIHIPIANREMDIATSGAEITKESIENIQMASEMYADAIEMLANEVDNHTLVILDSASRYKLLLDAKATILAAIAGQGMTEEAQKKESGRIWGNRNEWWQTSMILLRGIPGWVVATFMEEEVSKWVLDMNEKSVIKGTAKRMDPIKRIEAPRTLFNFDMMYHFELDPFTHVITAGVESGRYAKRGEGCEEYNKQIIDVKDEFSFLRLLDRMVKLFYE